MKAKPRVLIVASGSVATVKVPQIVAELSTIAHVRVVCSKSALHFLERAEVYKPAIWHDFLACGGWSLVYTDEDEWRLWNKLGDPVLHIELRRWADVLLVAPASADLIAKSSAGMADNLSLCVLRAWDFKKPLFLCPAMNTHMLDHPTTAISLQTLQTWGYRMIDPVRKTLACNETGNGALADVNDIVHAVKEALLAVLETKRAQHAVETDDDYDNNVVHGLKGIYQPTIRDRKKPCVYCIILQWVVFLCFHLLLRYIESFQHDVCNAGVNSNIRAEIAQAEKSNMTKWCGWELDAVESTLGGTLMAVFFYLLGGHVFGRESTLRGTLVVVFLYLLGGHVFGR